MPVVGDEPFTARFYNNQREFTGAEYPDGNLLLLFNCIPFRLYLSDFFKTGRVGIEEGSVDGAAFTHWFFTDRDGGILDSIKDEYQPYGVRPFYDTHCTIFSLYYEVKAWAEVHRRFEIGNMHVVDMINPDPVLYCENLLVLYRMLMSLFKDKPFIKKCNLFGPWRKYGLWAPGSYEERAKANIKELERFIVRYERARIRTQPPRQIPAPRPRPIQRPRPPPVRGPRPIQRPRLIPIPRLVPIQQPPGNTIYTQPILPCRRRGAINCYTCRKSGN